MRAVRFFVALLSTRSLELPSSYAQAGAAVGQAANAAQLLEMLRSGDVRLCLIDLATEGTAAALLEILQTATTQDPPPFVALFGECAAPPPGPQGPMKVTISLGIAAIPAHAGAAEALIQEADRALYAAKAAGRNRSIAAPPPSVKRAAG